jgi:hypothetical protein
VIFWKNGVFLVQSNFSAHYSIRAFFFSNKNSKIEAFSEAVGVCARIFHQKNAASRPNASETRKNVVKLKIDLSFSKISAGDRPALPKVYDPQKSVRTPLPF